jgi:hypothetical protein
MRSSTTTKTFFLAVASSVLLAKAAMKANVTRIDTMLKYLELAIINLLKISIKNPERIPLYDNLLVEQ